MLGKAIIASDCTGNREQITHDVSGYLIPLTAEAIAASVKKLLTDTDKLHQFEQASKQVNLAHSEDMKAFYELL